MEEDEQKKSNVNELDSDAMQKKRKLDTTTKQVKSNKNNATNIIKSFGNGSRWADSQRTV
jgi:hypothetical protein